MTDSKLKCQIFKGMCSDELAVRVHAIAGEVSFFVPRDSVQGDVETQGTVRVRVFKENGHAWAQLPDETQTTIAVDEAQLVARSSSIPVRRSAN